MMERITQASLGLKARIAGAFCLLTILTGAFAAFVTVNARRQIDLGEGALTVWLLVKGVNAQRWQEQAGAAGS